MWRAWASRACVLVSLTLWVIGNSWAAALEGSTHGGEGAGGDGNASAHDDGNGSCHSEEHEGGIHLMSFRWHEVGVYYTVTTFVIVAGLCKDVNQGSSNMAPGTLRRFAGRWAPLTARRDRKRTGLICKHRDLESG
ncbi:uncharacterized protein LOC134778074 [Penaeus indicus]|uniref:uncharacterized protein LOC134778074 n=1 Tax=Penaeus indicus TaxID=29960 RepID=UPI00300C927E